MRIGTVHGTELRIDASFFLVAGLLAWSLVTMLGRTHPTWTVAAAATFTVVAMALFLFSVLLHEAARVVAAESLSLRVRRVTLFLVGGAADLEKPADTPTAEGLVAFAGPLVNLVVGAGATVFASFAFTRVTLGDAGLDALADVPPFSMLALFFAAVNLGLGLVHLVPAIPLDGGALLQAILWRVSGDRRRSVQLTCFSSRIVGWSTVIMGFLTMLTGLRPQHFELEAHVLGGLWLGVLGLFVAIRAGRHARRMDAIAAGRPSGSGM